MNLPKLSKTSWSIITGLVVVLSLITGIWRFDDRYAKAEDLSNTKTMMEKQTIQTFEAFQQKQETINNGLRLDLLNLEYERIKIELKNLGNALKEDPTNFELSLRIEELNKNILEINNKRTELRNKLLGVE